MGTLGGQRRSALRRALAAGSAAVVLLTIGSTAPGATSPPVAQPASAAATASPSVNNTALDNTARYNTVRYNTARQNTGALNNPAAIAATRTSLAQTVRSTSSPTTERFERPTIDFLPSTGGAFGSASLATASSVVHNGAFDQGTDGWFRSYLAEATTASIVDDGSDRELLVTVDATEGSVAQDLALAVEPGTRYAASIRASSPTGLPVLVELVVHSLTASGTIGETSSRFVMVEGYEVPITTTLVPTESHPSVRFEVYVHTVDRAVRLDDAALLIDGAHHSADNYGYQRPLVRYLDDADPTALEPGGRYRVEVSVATTTDQPWSCCGVGAVRLGTEDADLVGGSDRPSVLHTDAAVDGSRWLSPNRVEFDKQASTIGGTFTTVITAPTTPGPFAERFRLVAEHVTWVPGPVIEIIGSVAEASVSDEPVVEAPSDNPLIDLLSDCPADNTVDGPHPAHLDCVERIDGFDLTVASVEPGAFTMGWNRPDAVSVDFFLLEVEDLGLPSGPLRENEARTLETGRRDLFVQAPPGRYLTRVIALDENGQWVRSDNVQVEVLDPAPITEADLPPVDCPAPPVIGSGFPVPCTPRPGDPPSGPSPTPGVPDCAPVGISFEDDVLMRYRGSDETTVTEIDLSCTEYEIELWSTDERHGPGYQADQTGERWYLVGLDALGDVIYTSPVTNDLPPTETESMLLVGPANLDGVVSFQGRHFGGGDSANSITVSAVLRPVR